MKLSEHIENIRSADTPDALEKAFRATFDQFRPRTIARLHRAVIERGLELCQRSKRGALVPRWDGRHRRLHVAGQSYRVVHGGNSTGIRYAWHDAKEWARGVLREQNLDEDTIEIVLEWWREYPHRALRALP